MYIHRLKKRILDIVDYCYFDLPRPNALVTRSEFFYRSKARWAVKEIRDAICASDKNPCKVISEFIVKMDQYALRSKTDVQKQTFSIAYDTAVWVEDVVIAELHRNFKER